MFTNNEKKQFAKFHFAGGVLHGEIVSVDGDIYTIIEKDGTKHKVKKEKIIQIY
jgi:preprotein translocase subunit YajC